MRTQNVSEYMLVLALCLVDVCVYVIQDVTNPKSKVNLV